MSRGGHADVSRGRDREFQSKTVNTHCFNRRKVEDSVERWVNSGKRGGVLVGRGVCLCFSLGLLMEVELGIAVGGWVLLGLLCVCVWLPPHRLSGWKGVRSLRSFHAASMVRSREIHPSQMEVQRNKAGARAKERYTT